MKVTLHMGSNLKLEGELHIEHRLLMEVTPIIAPMVVVSQNWLSWVDSLDIVGCIDIQAILNKSWELHEQEWLQIAMQEA
eukprot:10046187-Ditylum_brightwellii.AAC.1